MPLFHSLLARLRALPVIATLRRVLRVLCWAGGSAAVLLAATFLLFTFYVLPRLDSYRPVLAQWLSATAGRPVSIGKLSGRWQGVAPSLTLQSVSLRDPAGGKALTLERVTLTPSWLSLPAREARLSLIRIEGPRVAFVRDADGRVSVNGFPLRGGGDGHAAEWLLRQSRIEVGGAGLSWQDDYLGLPLLSLEGGTLALDNGFFGHRLALSGRPAGHAGQIVEAAADWSGDRPADLAHFTGDVSLRLQGAQVGAWQRYLSAFGVLHAGQGSGALAARIDDGRLSRLEARFDVANAAYTPNDAGLVQIPKLGGDVRIVREGERYTVEASRLTLASKTGLAFSEASVKGYWQGGATPSGEIAVDGADIAHLLPLARPLGLDTLPLFARFAPSGRLRDVKIGWQGPPGNPQRYRLSAAFDRLAWAPFGHVPGVESASGRVAMDEKGGTLSLDSRAARLVFPDVFARPLPFDTLKAGLSWQRDAAGAITVVLDSARFANADLSGELAGRYRHAGDGPGDLTLKGRIDHLDARRVENWLPYQTGADTIAWLTHALQGGRLENVVLDLSGPLDAFPFKGGRGGHFEVSGRVRDGVLQYQKGWPLLDGVDADLVFRNETMTVTGRRVSTLGVPLTGVSVRIPDLSAPHTRLLITGHARAPLARMLDFTRKSPVDGLLDGFTGRIAATGEAGLDLDLDVPVSGPDPVRVRGTVSLADNTLRLGTLPLPVLQGVSGKLGFSERGVSSDGLRLDAFGGHFVLTAREDKDGRSRFHVEGEAETPAVLGFYVPVLGRYVTGRSRYVADFAVHGGLDGLTVRSDLLGSAITAPAPAAKPSAEAMPLELHLAAGQKDTALDFSLGHRATGRFRLDAQGQFDRGVVSVGRDAAALPDVPGLLIRVGAPVIDLAAWSAALPEEGGDAGALTLRVDLDTPQLRYGNLSLNAVRARLQPAAGGWNLQLAAKEAEGALDWQGAGKGLLRARLKRLTLPDDLSGSGSAAAVPDSSRYPALDLAVDDLRWQGRSLGRLEVGAHPQPAFWQLSPLRLSNADGSLSGEAEVYGGTAARVATRFSVNSGNVGRLLARFGLPDTFYKGEGLLSGAIGWTGGPTDFDTRRLSGRMDLALRSGRFARVDPGVARLLGVLSLQSLPRRIRLDFTDVFSDGFAFDDLTGSARVSQGVFVSDDLKMSGPAADVRIRGQVDLGRETQRLMVHVEPHLAESVALAAGAALINPVVGVAALAAQKVLQDPVSRIFSVDYLVTGSLSDPVVTKTAQQGRAPKLFSP